MRAAGVACALLVLLCLSQASAQKLTGNLTSGITCTPDAGGLLGTGCPKGEGCCPTTNACVKIASCGEYVKLCPPVTCGKDTSFAEITCPVEASKVFKSAKDLKCLESKDTVCSTNGTSMVVACRSGAGSVAAQVMVVVIAALATTLLWQL